MSLAENMLATMSVSDDSVSYLSDEEPHIVINESRQAIVPNELKTIAVTGDKDIETVTFDCVRYLDGNDLSTFAIYLNYVLPDKTEGTYIPDSVIASDGEDVFHFDWKIKSNITQKSGKIAFAITAIKTKQNESGETVVDKQWGSIPNGDCSIALGLGISNVPSEEESSDVVAQLSAILEQINLDIVDWVENVVVQTTGDSETAVMSQKSVTKAIGEEKSRAISRENEIEELFTAPTQEAVNAWLDEHPEATTTVQDGSLTEDKFTEHLKLYTIKDYVTPQMFGAKGDGVTDDTEAFQKCFENRNVYIPSGAYIISDTIQVLAGTTIKGERRAGVTIKFENDLLFNCAGRVSISAMLIEGNTENTAIVFPYRDLSVKDVTFKNLGSAICSYRETYIAYNSVTDCSFVSVKYPLNFSKADIVNTTIILNCDFHNYINVLTAKGAFYSIDLDRCIFEGTGEYIISCEDCRAFSLRSCYIESAGCLMSEGCGHGIIAVYDTWIHKDTVFVSKSSASNLCVRFCNSYITNVTAKNGGETFDCLIDGTNLSVELTDCQTGIGGGLTRPLKTADYALSTGVATNCLITFENYAPEVKVSAVEFHHSLPSGEKPRLFFNEIDNSITVNWGTNTSMVKMVPFIKANNVEELNAIAYTTYANGEILFGSIIGKKDLYVLRNGKWFKLILDGDTTTETWSFTLEDGTTVEKSVVLS